MRLSSLLFLFLTWNAAHATDLLSELHLEKFTATAAPLHFAAGERQRSLADYKDKFVILHLWASWCRPCQAEMPALLRFAERVRDPRLEILFVSVDKPAQRDEVKKIFADLKMPEAPYMAAGDDDSKRYFAWGVPMTYLFDPQGHLLARGMGALPWDAGHPEALKKLMDQWRPPKTEK